MISGEFFGRIIHGNQGKIKNLVFAFSIILNLAALCYFKYAKLVVVSCNQLLDSFERLQFAPASDFAVPDVILPLGISFFVFEFIHYLTDVWKGANPIKRFSEFALFAAFFPSQIAGPIKRFQDFSKSFDFSKRFDKNNLWDGLTLIAQGLFKKVAIADNLSPIVNLGFANARELGTVDAVIVLFSFAFQIYFDFAGYTDIGIGSAKLFGIQLPENFNKPYLALSLTEFWKRWHISLSSWLRDYLYIPLGGSKCSTLRKYNNLLITMLLGGLWHGASWQFLIWGGIHGGGLVINHSYQSLVEKPKFAALKALHERPLMKLLCWALTLSFVWTGWIFFRASTTWEAVKILRHFVLWSDRFFLAEVVEASPAIFAFLLYALFVALTDGKSWAFLGVFRKWIGDVWFVRPTLVGATFVITLAFTPLKASPFIYFQF